MLGMQFFYMKKDFYAGQFTKHLVPKSFALNERLATFFISILNKYQRIFQNVLVRDFEKVFNRIKVQLPTKNGKIDFNKIEDFIAKLEVDYLAELQSEHAVELNAYLSAGGLKDYTLTVEEQSVLIDFEHRKIEWDGFSYKSIFDKILQGRRLRKQDQIPGNIPFVMAGTTNTGVVNYISNPVASFPENSITIDIFGNTFFRDYKFGAGDDTGVYWNSKNSYSTETLLFFAASMGKSVLGKFSYGKKLRSSQSVDFNMQVPTKKGQPDYALMDTLVSAIKKLVIKDVALNADNKIKTAKSIINI